jgi:hypothetical protein
MAIANEKYFVPPEATQTLLRVRGFSANGFRSGGIVDPKIVDLPVGTILIRLYHMPNKDYGEWWATPRELSVIADHFARGGDAFDVGRPEGKGILHAVFAVRHDWGGHSPEHLGSFLVVRLSETLKAYHGEGDHAPDETYTKMQKVFRIFDETGRQRAARQVMLPKPWEYKALMPRIMGGTGPQALLDAVTQHNNQRLLFE